MRHVRQSTLAVSVLAICFAAGAANGQPATEAPPTTEETPPTTEETPPTTEETPPTAEELGYSVVLEEEPAHLRILRNGEEVWSLQSWMIFVDAEGDLTGDGLPNLLVSEASSRSFRSITLLELGPDGVRVVWEIGGHVTELRDADGDIHRRLEAGESLATPPGRPMPPGLRRMDVPEILEGTGEPAATEPASEPTSEPASEPTSEPTSEPAPVPEGD